MIPTPSKGSIYHDPRQSEILGPFNLKNYIPKDEQLKYA